MKTPKQDAHGKTPQKRVRVAVQTSVEQYYTAAMNSQAPGKATLGVKMQGVLGASSTKVKGKKGQEKCLPWGKRGGQKSTNHCRKPIWYTKYATLVKMHTYNERAGIRKGCKRPLTTDRVLDSQKLMDAEKPAEIGFTHGSSTLGKVASITRNGENRSSDH